MSTQDQAGGGGGGGRRGGKKKGRRPAGGRADEDENHNESSTTATSLETPSTAPSSTTTTTTSPSGGVEEALRESASKIIQQTSQGRSISIPQQKGAAEGTITPFNTPVNPNIVAAAVAANKTKAGGAGTAGGAGGAAAAGGGGGAGRRNAAKNRNNNNNAEEDADDHDDGDESARVEDGLIRLTQDVKAKLGQLAIDDFLSKLPANVLKRVNAVQGIQGEISELHQRFLDEVKALERKYESLYAPHYARRKEIVAGDREPTDEELKRGEAEVEKDKLPFQAELKDEEDDEEEAEEKHAPVEDSKEPGIPGFWLRALQQHELFEQNIQERDEDALKSLVDVSCETFDRSQTEKGFTLQFRFSPNPFFKNELLTKSYYLVEEEELMLDRAEGTQIDWKEGQNLTVKTVRKRQKHRGGKNVRTVTKQVPCDSFFNFFSPPRMEDLDAADEAQQSNIEELLEADFELGQTLKEAIIPRAVDFFTGKAIMFGEMDDEDFDEEDFDEDPFEGELDDDDDDDDDGPPARGPAKRGGRGNARAAAHLPTGGDAAAGEQPECKQQ